MSKFYIKFTSFLFLAVLIFPLELFALDENLDEALEAIEEKCPAGAGRCYPLRSKIEIYAKCINLMCVNYPKKRVVRDIRRKLITLKDKTDEEKFTEKYKTCDMGLRRCNILRDDEPQYYWACMEDTCNNLAKTNPDLNSSCAKGHKECKALLRTYAMCMKLICENDVGEYKECKRGITRCASSVTRYWDCVSIKCLGNVQEYRDPKLLSEYDIQVVKVQDPQKLDGKGKDIIRVVRKGMFMGIRGFPPAYQYPPPDVDPVDWRTIAMIPPKRAFQGTAIGAMECFLRSATMKCASRDMLTCRCSDGSIPRKKGTRWWAKNGIFNDGE